MSQKFNPSRVIVLSELSARQKEKYYQIILSNKLKFRKDGNGQYITNLRILAPGIKKANATEYVVGSNVHSNKTVFNLESRLKQLDDDNIRLKNVNIVNDNNFDYSLYDRFAKLIAIETNSISPKLYTLSALMKRIEVVYDTRQIFAIQHNEVPSGIEILMPPSKLPFDTTESSNTSVIMNQPISSIFPFFYR